MKENGNQTPNPPERDFFVDFSEQKPAELRQRDERPTVPSLSQGRGNGNRQPQSGYVDFEAEAERVSDDLPTAIPVPQRVDERGQRAGSSGIRKNDSGERMSGEPSRSAPRNAPRKKKRKILRRILITLLVLVLLLVGGVVFVFSGLEVKPLTTDMAALGIDPAIAEKYKDSGVTNIALFGVDSRDYDSTAGRSDAIMILSVDRKHNLLKLTSVLRDSYVAIDGHGSEKITHAYVYGGPELAIRTLNQNFQLDIQSYATVNFSQLASVIDAVGGVEIEITEKERQQINALANSEGLSSPEVPAAGVVRLTGGQATAYSRIRSIDSDTARANRQRVVLEAMLVSIKSANIFQYPDMARQVLSEMESSLDFASVVKMSPAILFGQPSLVQMTLPTEEDGARGGNVGGHWVWQFDVAGATSRLHEFIYEYDGKT